MSDLIETKDPGWRHAVVRPSLPEIYNGLRIPQSSLQVIRP